LTTKISRYVWPPIVLALLLATVSTVSQSASFDCAKAAMPIEKLICTDAELSRLDEELAVAYRAALALASNTDSFKIEQRKWLAATRGQCADTPCLKRAYRARLAELSGAGAAAVVPDPADNRVFAHLNQFGGGSPDDVLRDKRIGTVLRGLLGKSFRRLQDNLAVSGGVSINTAGALEVEGCAPHICTIEDAFLYIERSGKVYVILHTGDKALYFTNNDAYRDRMIAPLETFVKRFDGAEVVYMNANPKNP
jgi:uncharacterized protein